MPNRKAKSKASTKTTDAKTLRTFERALRNALSTPAEMHAKPKKKRRAKTKTAKKATRKKKSAR